MHNLMRCLLQGLIMRYSIFGVWLWLSAPVRLSRQEAQPDGLILFYCKMILRESWNLENTILSYSPYSLIKYGRSLLRFRLRLSCLLSNCSQVLALFSVSPSHSYIPLERLWNKVRFSSTNNNIVPLIKQISVLFCMACSV